LPLAKSISLPRAAGHDGATFAYTACFAAIVLVTLFRIIITYPVLSHTVDEPAHIVAGARFLAEGRAAGDLTHPPLARVAVAIGPTLLQAARAGCPIDREESLIQCEGASYWRTLSAARLGTLPFVVLALVLVWRWGTYIGGPIAGLLAALLFANSPLTLAHAGLATTDMGAAATFTLALLAWSRWHEQPTLRHAIAVGICSGIAAAAKLSAVLFVPVAALVLTMLVPVRPSRWEVILRHACAAAAAGVATLWVSYGFTLNAIADAPLLDWKIFPLVEFIRGLLTLAEINHQGLPTYFMGEIREGSWWEFFPVMLAVKTPLPMLLFTAVGVVVASRYRRRPVLALAAAGAAIFTLGIISNLNLGLRHMLPAYVLMSIVAGVGAAAFLESATRPLPRVALVLLCGWQILDVARAHPDYIPYFNVASREHAIHFSADSDFDWGQDARRLADVLKQRGIRQAHVAINGTSKIAAFKGIEAKHLWPGEPASGWVAAGIGRILVDRVRPPYLGLRWLECHRPEALIGQTILLYYIPPGQQRRTGTCDLDSLTVARQ
jgi:hypothetical protein